MALPGKHLARALWLGVTLALAIAGCGPIGYIGGVTRTASTAVDEASAVNAAKYAPYWWTRATEYLHKAREEAATADFEAANRFGRLATDAAEHARADAIRRAADPALMQEITAPPAARKSKLAPAIEDSGDDEGTR